MPAGNRRFFVGLYQKTRFVYILISSKLNYMTMQHILENLSLGRSLYQQLLDPVAKRYSLTSMELTVLLFLANNPEYKTAKDIVEVRQIAKSHASLAIGGLEEKGYLEKSVDKKDKRASSLQILSKAEPIIQEGRKAQEQFQKIINAGFTKEEMQFLEEAFQRMNQNIKNYQEQ